MLVKAIWEQGEGKQVRTTLIYERENVPMQFARLNRRLEGIEDASKKGYPIRNLYRLMYLPEIWQEAYANIYSNKGATTKGVDDITLDGMSHQRIDNIIKALKEKKYKLKPARRTYIKKRNGKLRPLGIASGDDKLVQEVVRIILERIYEPIFSESSHGFRPRRSCHTALQRVRKRWTGVKWLVEFDIEGFFDNMDHDIMTKLLQKKIKDRRFLKLIKSMLKAGYLEDWKYHKTYSGTPQGGGVSPILSNIYLFELDKYIEECVRKFNKGKSRPINPEYKKLCNKKYNLRKKIDREGTSPKLLMELSKIDQKMKELPYGDPYSQEYKRLKYCRYADDFVRHEARYVHDVFLHLPLVVGRQVHPPSLWIEQSVDEGSPGETMGSTGVVANP